MFGASFVTTRCGAQARCLRVRVLNNGALAYQTFLRGRHHQLAVAREELPTHKCPCAGGGGAFHGVEQPRIQAVGGVKPHAVIEACHLHAWREPADTVGAQRGGQKTVV
jgi:hypothetical protein